MAEAKKDRKEAKKDPDAAAENVQPVTKKEPTPELRTGMTVRVHQKITEQGAKGTKERVQIFEGIILAHRGGNQPGATITVRKISDGIGVEKIFPLHSPLVVKIEPVKQATNVRQAKAYYLRNYKKRLKEIKIANG